tara:strand:+ start:45 stop:599 length:555 start_codon:yes stop_codon:yes gene_type:complete
MNSNQRVIKLNNIDEEKSVNDKLYGRNIPSFFLKPNFDFRPVPTKYTFFDFVTEKPKSKEEITPLNDYSVEKVFYPGDSKPPFSYFSKNIDHETNLRNQFMALQKNDQAFYVPSSNSDLYVSKGDVSSSDMMCRTPNFYKLPDEEIYLNSKKNLELKNMNSNLFNNNTRLNYYNDNRNNLNKNN